MPSGRYRKTQFPDTLNQQSQAAIAKVVDDLDARIDILSSPTMLISTSGAIKPGASIVSWAGSAGGVLTLPGAASQGRNVSAFVVVGNPTASSVTLIPSGTDKIHGGKGISLGAGLQALMSSDGGSNWIATGIAVTSLLAGLVPAPGSPTGRFFRDDLTWAAVSATGRLLRTTYITAVTTLASVAGCTYYEVEGVGCGGGGGGCVANSAAAGGGGGAGAPGEWTGTIIPVNWAIVHGTVGAGGTTAGGDGGTGTNSTFSDGTNVLTLPGGNGGKGDVGGSSSNMSAGGGPSAAATNSKFAGTGAPGDDTKKANVASKVVAGSGGSSRYGGGGKGGSNVSQDGPAGTGFGSGGAGGSDIASTSARVGGPGAPDLFILREYS